MIEFKETDIGQIPVHWSLMTVDDIKSPTKKSIISGPFGSSISAKYFVDSGVPVIRGNNLSLDIHIKFKDDGYVYITDEKANELGTWAEKDDLIFTAVGTIGQVGILLGKETYSKYIISNKQLRLRVNTELIEPLYAYYWFASPFMVDMILQRNTGSSVPLINLSVLKSLLIPIPPKKERTSILNIISSLDNKIDLLHRQNATLEKMAETLFRQWFIEEAKEDWATGKVSDLIKILSGFAFKSSSFVESGKYRLITIKGVQDGYLELNNADRIEELPDRLPEFCKLEIGDILLSLTGNVGRCCLVDTKDLLLNQRVAKLEPMKERDRAYTYFLFRLPQIKQLLEEMGKGTAQSNLSPIETSNMELIIPDESRLEEFSAIATPWLNKLLFNKKSIQTLTQLRDSLLPKLMSGEVSVDIK